MSIYDPGYPPEFDGPDHCLVCNKWIGTGEAQCECPECPECGGIGDPDCYNNGHLDKGNRAFNLTDLAAHLGATHDTEASIARRLYKDTQCGIGFSVDQDQLGVSIAGYAEGSGDAECESYGFRFPIDLDEFDTAVERADREGCELYDEFHCSECGAERDYESPCEECRP